MCVPTESSPTKFNTEIATRQQAQADERRANNSGQLANKYNSDGPFRGLKPGDKFLGVTGLYQKIIQIIQIDQNPRNKEIQLLL